MCLFNQSEKFEDKGKSLQRNRMIVLIGLFVKEAPVTGTINASMTLGPGMFLTWKESVWLGN